MKLGVCYYPEHWPKERWETDAREMRAAGISVVRIAEFAWSKIEPAEGQYDWGWLDRAIEILSAEGLEIVLGTPTAAPPAWLVSAHPDILPVDIEGRRRRFGSRRHYCANNIWMKEYTRRIVTAMAQRYSSLPAVTSWQIDNEFSCHDTARCYCPVCAEAFRRWLQAKYETLEKLNQTWGTVFWSQTYSNWEQIEPPNLLVAQPNPSHVQDYTRFSSDSVAAFQQIQVDILRKVAPGQQLTTNFLADFAGLNYHSMARPLDFASLSSYPTGYREMKSGELYGPDEPSEVFAYDAGDPHVTAFYHDLVRGLKGAPYWVMEQQAGQINWSLHNTGVRLGNVRLWTWHALACGAEAVVYFRWRASLYGHEQHHSGLLKHDGTADQGYRDLLALLPEHETMQKVSQAPFETQAAVLFDFDDLWALDLQPHNQDYSYISHLFLYYRTLQQLGIPVDLCPRQADISRYKLLIAHTSWLADQALASRLQDYVQAGGTLLFGVRSGYKTPANTVCAQPLPGPLRELVGAQVSDWHALLPGISYEVESRLPGLAGRSRIWAESLQPMGEARGKEKVETLARYTSQPFQGQAALTQRKLGQGNVLYLGWYPSQTQARALLLHLSQLAGLERLAELPPGMIAVRRGGATLLFNFSDRNLSVRVGSRDKLVPARNAFIVE